MTNMTAAVWTDTETLEIQTLPLPDIPDDFVLLKVAHVGICGTDLAIYHGQHPRAQHGLIMGHEISGWIVDPERGLDKLGPLVVAEPLISCGSCGTCLSGNRHVCQNLGLFGIDEPGALAEYVALPERILHRVRPHIDTTVATLAEPLAVAVHALAMSAMKTGDIVGVYGAGPIGLLTAIMARHTGAHSVIITDPSPWRRKVARDFGFTVVEPEQTMEAMALELTHGNGFDLVFDAAGYPSVVAELTKVVRIRGQIVIVGVHKTPVPIDLRDVCFKEIDMVGVRVYTTEDFVEAVALINDGELELEHFPIQSFVLDNAEAAFISAARGTDCLKVLISPSGAKS
ncbi:MAG: alcohol dehydrogenase catalytic domain-containing protein [Actinomycetaceae bacterium]|nr:alcohol dehydrogenase catalytic domain-containing protein [Actinomycetaceae bacterium]